MLKPIDQAPPLHLLPLKKFWKTPSRLIASSFLFWLSYLFDELVLLRDLPLELISAILKIANEEHWISTSW
jgi:hypothetical protein